MTGRNGNERRQLRTLRRVFQARARSADYGSAAWTFPLVGAGIGAVCALAFLVAQLLRLGDWPAALLAVLAGLG